MTEYIYFVKCPNCDDEHFDFFDDAKDFALSCLGSKPVITQTEVCRNDFGECTDSHDLGIIWSWESEVDGVSDEEPAISMFTKSDLTPSYDPDLDPEFTELDNALDSVPDNFSMPSSADTSKEFLTLVASNDMCECKSTAKPIPEGMTIKELVEELEENEDIVECKCCDEPFPKEACQFEVDYGYLCPRCVAALKSRGETLTMRESVLDETEPVRSLAKKDHNRKASPEIEETADSGDSLTMCPECGSNSFDPQTGICVTCGFN